MIEVPILATVRQGGKSTTGYRSALRMYLGAYALWREERSRGGGLLCLTQPVCGSSTAATGAVPRRWRARGARHRTSTPGSCVSGSGAPSGTCSTSSASACSSAANTSTCSSA